MKAHIKKNVRNWTLDEIERVQRDPKLSDEERTRITNRLQANLKELGK